MTAPTNRTVHLHPDDTPLDFDAASALYSRLTKRAREERPQGRHRQLPLAALTAIGATLALSMGLVGYLSLSADPTAGRSTEHGAANVELPDSLIANANPSSLEDAGRVLGVDVPVVNDALGSAATVKRVLVAKPPSDGGTDVQVELDYASGLSEVISASDGKDASTVFEQLAASLGRTDAYQEIDGRPALVLPGNASDPTSVEVAVGDLFVTLYSGNASTADLVRAAESLG